MTDPAIPREVIFYRVDGTDKEPFMQWFNGLRDPKGRRDILRCLHKLKQGMYRNRKPLGDGISESRVFSGPGYRVYFGEHENKRVVLLGGDKDSQQNDIQRAKDYWKDYKHRKELF